MNEDIQQILSALLGYLQTAAGFAAEQAPLVLQEILNWAIAANALSMVVTAGIIYGFCAFLRSVWKRARMPYGNGEGESRIDTDDAALLTILPVIFIGVAGIGFLISMFELVKVLVAPRVFLIEYVSKLIS